MEVGVVLALSETIPPFVFSGRMCQVLVKYNITFYKYFDGFFILVYNCK